VVDVELGNLAVIIAPSAIKEEVMLDPDRLNCPPDNENELVIESADNRRLSVI
jgi:hypothetical protein